MTTTTDTPDDGPDASIIPDAPGPSDPTSGTGVLGSARTSQIAGWLAVAVLAWLFLWPVIRLGILSLRDGTFPTLTNFSTVLAEPATLTVVRNTLIVAVVGTVISMVAGVALAWVAAYTDIRFKTAFHGLVLLPFVLPGYLYTIAWVETLSPNGWILANFGSLPGLDGGIDIYSLSGIAFVLGLRHTALVYLLTLAVLRRIPRELTHAARICGATGWESFRRVTLPNALPGIAGGGLLAFLSNLDNFGIPAVLGIPAGISVLSTKIYQEVVSFGPSGFARAAVFSVVLGTVALAGTGIQQVVTRRSATSDTQVQDTGVRVHLGGLRPIVEIGLLLVMGVLSVFPLVAMVTSSLSPALGVPFSLSASTLDNYRAALFDNAASQRALVNSLQFATTTAVVGIIIATAVAHQRTRRGGLAPRAMDSLISLPYALPGMVIALAMILAWLQPIPGLDWNPGLYGTAGIIMIAYVVRFTYYQLRAMVTGFSQVEASMENAARVSGVGPFHTWRRVLLPLLLPSILSGTALVVFVSLTELTVSSILWSTGSETIGVRVFGFQAAGYSGYATALSATVVLAMLLAAGVVALFTRYWRSRTRTGTTTSTIQEIRA